MGKVAVQRLPSRLTLFRFDSIFARLISIIKPLNYNVTFGKHECDHTH